MISPLKQSIAGGRVQELTFF